MRRAVVLSGLRLAAQNHQLRVATRALRLPRLLSNRSTSTAAFDGWMKRTITFLYGAQLFINVVKGLAAVGAALVVLYGLYRTQGRIDRSRDLIDNARAVTREKFLASSDAIKRTASRMRKTMRLRVENLISTHRDNLQSDTPQASHRALTATAASASMALSSAKAKLNALREGSSAPKE
ncbi:transmembrane protein, putative [Bodo saltans]|uniref:Transmembrane protein, putative n=1 Tax=Bodo saltans TaxID=75058 RepID=A0A0S4JEU0_BODSA|nr:transmembrane protein, putative [Bodo saltans]|eukprot:CUG90004.1 transmembrane protein, putative [Bodo saltans]